MYSHRAASAVMVSRSTAVALLALLPLCAASAQSSPPFYQGKQIELDINSSVGGGYDLYARLLARHMGKHIPGNPTIVPKNMVGASGLKP